GANVGTCTRDGTAPGTACRADEIECDDPLFCISSFSDRTCKTVGHNSGDACGPWGACSFDSACVMPDPTDPYHGLCTPPGGAGAPCRTTNPVCDAGLVCQSSRCTHVLALGDSCFAGGRAQVCPSGASCVRESSSGSGGVCRANGTEAGAACRSGANA